MNPQKNHGPVKAYYPLALGLQGTLLLHSVDLSLRLLPVLTYKRRDVGVQFSARNKYRSLHNYDRFLLAPYKITI